MLGVTSMKRSIDGLNRKPNTNIVTLSASDAEKSVQMMIMIMIMVDEDGISVVWKHFLGQNPHGIFEMKAM